MLELLFGLFIGVWLAQQLPMPDVHHFVMSRIPTLIEDKKEGESKEDGENKDDIPLFTGDLPQAV